jgi:DNA-binding NarL/FixJ family response regulator
MHSHNVLGVLSVDDNPMVAEALERAIASAEGLRHEGHFFGGEGVVEMVVAKHPAVVLLDLEMPDTDTPELVQQLTAAAPDTRVVMLSGHLRKDDIIACIEAGAFGYIHKSRTPDYILTTVRRVAAGEFVLCEQAAMAAGMA